MLLPQSVSVMPTARTLKALTFVLVTWDSQEMAERAKVNEVTNKVEVGQRDLKAIKPVAL